MSKNKKNGFFMYMLERGPGIMASGEKLNGGIKDLANLVNDDWAKLSKEEKEVYNERAKARNQQEQKKGTVGGSVQSQRERERMAQEKLYLQARRQREQLKKEIQDANRTRTLKIFEDKESWMEHPIVVCSFNSYYKPNGTDPYLPAEIGLSTFSVKGGVCDNFARVINTLEIPKGYGFDATRHTEYLGIPMPGPANEFSDFQGVMAIIENYLEKYRGNFKQEDGLCVFSLDTEYDQVTGCFKWLQENAKTKLTIHVMSLPLFGYLASTESSKFFRKEWINGSEDEWISSDRVKWMGNDAIGPPTSVHINVLSNRKIGKPSNSEFIYSGLHPLTQYGLFNTIRQVDELLVNSENYKFYSGLACVYHFRTAEMIHHCALNQANRYAFYLLEILTISNVVKIIPGAHYPQLENQVKEVARRHSWLKKWGITQVEENMKDPPPPMKITKNSSVYDKNAIRILNKKKDCTGHDFTAIPEGDQVGMDGLAIQVIVNRDPRKAVAHLERNKTEMQVDISSNDPDVNPFQGMQYPPFFHCRVSGDSMFPIKLSTITERKWEEEQDLIDLFTAL